MIAKGPMDDIRIFATLAFGLDPEVWGAFGFASDKVRNDLAQEIRPQDRVLIIGTHGPETHVEEERGRLLGLIEAARQAVNTGELVEPSRWQRHLDEFNGVARWPYGMPIASAEKFDKPLPESREILPRIYERNLHMKLATHYEALMPDEVARVLALPRHPVKSIWRTPRGSFAANLLQGRPGPPPSLPPRLLTPSSGPAATYCLALKGGAAREASEPVLGRKPDWSVFKVGFTNNPSRRRDELAAYFPHAAQLDWKFTLLQWHADEINAYAMEQEVFAQLARLGSYRFKGEMVAASEAMIAEAWNLARLNAQRPVEPVEIGPDHEAYTSAGRD